MNADINIAVDLLNLYLLDISRTSGIICYYLKYENILKVVKGKFQPLIKQLLRAFFFRIRRGSSKASVI